MSTRQSKNKEAVSIATDRAQMSTKRKGVPKRKITTRWGVDLDEILAELRQQGITIEQAAVDALLLGVEDAANEFSRADPDRVAKRLGQLKKSKAPKRHYDALVADTSNDPDKIKRKR